jgi:hypothetical protein
MYKNWSNNARVDRLGSMWQFMKMKKTLMDKNEDVIEKLGLLELEENDNKLYAIFCIFLHCINFLFIFC